jgi:putative ABC transport system permease protein
MNLKYTLKTAIKSLQTNKSRTMLTILGIVIGITAIMMVMSLGKGAQNLILGEIQSIGSTTIMVNPGRESKGFSPATALNLLFNDSLKERERAALARKENVPYADEIDPMIAGSEVVLRNNLKYRAMIVGSSEATTDIFNMYPQEGVFFSADDVAARADVAVIGKRIKDELFDNENAIGEKIKINGTNFRVIGILPDKGPSSLMNFNESVYIPYTTAQKYILGFKYFNHIIIKTESEQMIDRTVEDIKITLRNLHNITDPEKDDFHIETQADLVKTVSQVTNILTAFLAAVAAISLLVGGVGIMNIMLVSVTERTREIGLRKALGATKKDILTQFLLESITLTASGGLIGIIMGSSFSFLVSLALRKLYALNWTFSFPVIAALLGLGVASLVGLVFGIYPARQAASKSPIEALRYE